MDQQPSRRGGDINPRCGLDLLAPHEKPDFRRFTVDMKEMRREIRRGEVCCGNFPVIFVVGKQPQVEPLTPVGSEQNRVAPHREVQLIYSAQRHSGAGACPAAPRQRYNPHRETFGRLSLHFQPPLTPFEPGRPLKRLSSPFKLFLRIFLLLLLPLPSFLLPSSSPNDSLSHSLARSPLNCLHGYLCCI